MLRRQRREDAIAGRAPMPSVPEAPPPPNEESAFASDAASTTSPSANKSPADIGNDGFSGNDRAVIDGVQTSLDQFRGTPFYQVDLRVSRNINLGERLQLRPFAEFFNLFDRQNPGNNYVGDISALPTPVNDLSNATSFCLNAACTQTTPITSYKQLRVPAGALGDFFGPGTTVGIPFAAQLGLKLIF